MSSIPSWIIITAVAVFVLVKSLRPHSDYDVMPLIKIPIILLLYTIYWILELTVL